MNANGKAENPTIRVKDWIKERERKRKELLKGARTASGKNKYNTKKDRKSSWSKGLKKEKLKLEAWQRNIKIARLQGKMPNEQMSLSQWQEMLQHTGSSNVTPNRSRRERIAAEEKAYIEKAKREKALKLKNDLAASKQRAENRAKPKSRNIPEGTIKDTFTVSEDPNALGDIRSNQAQNKQTLNHQAVEKEIIAMHEEFEKGNLKGDDRKISQLADIKRQLKEAKIAESSKRAEARSQQSGRIPTAQNSKQTSHTGNFSGSLFNSKDSLVSLDIETSGLDRKEDFIWSVGFADSKGEREHFVKRQPGKRGEAKKKTLKNLYENDIFGIEGYHDAYKKSLTEGTALTPKQSLANIFKEIDGKSMLLIQNINFENKMIAEVLDRSPASKVDRYAKSFAYVTDDHKNKLLYSPPEVTIARYEAMRESTLLGKTSDPLKREERVKKISGLYQGMLSEYNKSIDTKKGTVAVELMDISNAMFAMAAEKNKISSEHIGIGLKVDFLKQALFKGMGAEKHTAAADAADQVKIFNKLGEMMSQISTNSISESNLDVLARVRAAQPFESASQFMSGIRSTLEELQRSSVYDKAGKLVTPGETRLINPESVRYKSVSVNGQTYKGIGPDWYDKMIPRTSDATEARNHVVERFFRKGVEGVDVEEFADSLKGLSLEDQISKAKEGQKFFGDKVSRILNNSRDMSESFSDAISKMKHKKKIGLGLAAIGAYALTRGEDDERSYEERTQEKMYARSNDRTFNMYSRPEVYHGTGLYTWENATRHHEY